MSYSQSINIINIDIIQPQNTKLAQISLEKSVQLKDRFNGQKYSSTNNSQQRQHSKTLNSYQSVKVVSNVQNITIKTKRVDENKVQRVSNVKEQVLYKRSPNRVQQLKNSTNLSSLVSPTNKLILNESILPNYSPQNRDHLLTEITDSQGLRTKHVGTRTSSRQISVCKVRCVNNSISHSGTPLNKSPLKNAPCVLQPKGSQDSSVQLTPKIQSNNQLVSNIRIFVRVRPINKFESELTQNQLGENTLQIMSDQKIAIPNERMLFTFTKVFGSEYNQETVFNDVGRDTVKEVLTGYNGTIIAYGPTGSGKTHSMFGILDNVQQEGLIPRACKQVFEHIRNQSDQKYTIYCEMMEIYQENLNDLLSLDKQELKIKESPSEGVYVKGLTRIAISTENELMEAVSLGNQAKKIKSTKINEYSSRSHTLLTIEIISRASKDNDGSSILKKRGRLNLVDLAGSEKVNKSGAVGVTLEEAKKINLSLSCLGNVIHALSNNNEHIPYRDSKLTRILQESIGGNYKTSMIVTCSPHSSSLDETITTLKFAIRAKSVKNYCKQNFKPCGDSMKSIVSQLSQELVQTKMELSNFKLALIRIKEHIQGQNQDHFMSYDKAIETVRVLDELIKRQSNKQATETVIEPQQTFQYDFNDVRENLQERFPQVSSEIDSVIYQKAKSQSLTNNSQTLDSMVPLLIQVNNKEKSKEQIGQLKIFLKEKDDLIIILEKQVEDIRSQSLSVEKQNVQLKEEVNQLKLQQSKSDMNMEYSQVQVNILQKQLQTLLEQMTQQEQVISYLHTEKRDIVNKSFEQFLKQDLNFQEIKLTDYFMISVNFQQNVQRMSLDDQSLFTMDPFLGQEFKDSFITQLDFDKTAQFTSQEACQGVTLMLSFAKEQEKEAIVFLLKHQLINAHILNQHLIRIISTLEWKQLIEYGRGKLRNSLLQLKQDYTVQLESVLQSTGTNFCLLKDRIEQVELDMLKQNEKALESSYSLRVLQKRKKQQLDSDELFNEDNNEIKRILKELDLQIQPATYEQSIKLINQKNFTIKKIASQLQKCLIKDQNSELFKFSTLQQQELNRLQNKVVLLQSELQMESCKSQQYFKAYQKTSEHLNFMKQFSQDLETALGKRLKEENESWQSTVTQIKQNSYEEIKQKQLKFNKLIEQVNCCLSSISSRLENIKQSPEQFIQLQNDITVFRERFFLA